MFTLLAVLCALTGCPAAQCQDWPTYCHDHARSAQTTDAGPTAATIAWATVLGESVDGSPVVAGDYVYVGNSAGRVFAVRRDTGAIVWQQATGGAILGAAEVSAGRVFVGSGDGFVYAFEAVTGKLLWRHRTLRAVLAGPLCLGEKVIFGSVDGTLRAVQADSGRTVWCVPGEAAISSPPAVRETTVYYGDEGGGLWARDANTGAVVWHATLAGKVIAAPVCAATRLIVPLMSLSQLSPPKTEYLTAWNLADGKQLWTAKPEAVSVLGTPLVLDNLVWAFGVEGYVSEGKLRGVRPDTGEQAIEHKFGMLVVDAAMALAGDTMYLAAENGVVYFRDARTGAAAKQVRLGGKVFSSPAVCGGRLYVGCQDGKLYCIQ